jgi:hypothetical protein
MLLGAPKKRKVIIKEIKIFEVFYSVFPEKWRNCAIRREAGLSHDVTCLGKVKKTRQIHKQLTSIVQGGCCGL